MTGEDLKAETSEGLQELQEREETDPVALAIEEGSPLRLAGGTRRSTWATSTSSSAKTRR